MKLNVHSKHNPTSPPSKACGLTPHQGCFIGQDVVELKQHQIMLRHTHTANSDSSPHFKLEPYVKLLCGLMLHT